jgi:hypothetical protein
MVMKFQKTKKSDHTSMQIFAMKTRYPNFTAKINRSKNEIEFIGDLPIKPELPIYTVSIIYRGDLRPIVRIKNPVLVDNPPHFYHDNKSLCLYHPIDYKWGKDKLIAIDIVPWVASWIYFYEVWLEHDEWLGPEAEHYLPKHEDL